ncbi:MAG TPA: serine protease [Solirubrobacterales bacterium]|nr:serine protease [Solirubrobacterales bacterium]
MKLRGAQPGRLTGAIALCALLAALLTPGLAQADERASASIVGGKVASITDFPSLAFIEAADKENRFACTGTVIAPRVILTAAHCVEDLQGKGGFTPIRNYAVATGATNPFEAEKENVSRITATHVFPGFDPGNLHGDAAVLVLEKATTAPPIAIATSADSALYDGGATVQLAGWGLMKGDAGAAPSHLRSASTVLQAPSFCQRKTQAFYRPYSQAAQMCTLDSTTKATGGCYGDSGGPAIAVRPDGTQVEVGITSTGGPMCNPKLPNVLTRTDAISTWALQWVAAVESGGPPPVVDPAAPLPPLNTESGGEFATFRLAAAFGARFVDSETGNIKCKRLARSRVGCEVFWIYGANIYGAEVKVFYLRAHDAVVWDSHFRARWGRLACLEDEDRRRPCPLQSKRG